MKKKVNKKAYYEKVVHIIDWTYIEESMSKKVGYNVEVRVGNGLVLNVINDWSDYYEPYAKDIIIDAECCGVQSNYRHLLYLTTDESGSCELKREFLSIDFYKSKSEEKVIGEDGFETTRKFVSMMPCFTMEIDVETIKKALTGDIVSVYEHCISRYGYNDRIQQNNSKTLKAIFGEEYKHEDTVTVNDEGRLVEG